MAKRWETPPLEHFARVMKHSDRRSGFHYDETASRSIFCIRAWRLQTAATGEDGFLSSLAEAGR